MKVTFLEGDETPQPKDVKRHAGGLINVGRFGKCEVEQAAGRLIDFLTDRRQGWKPFYFIGLISHYDAKRWDYGDFLYGLMGPWMDEYAIYTPPFYIVHCGSHLALTTQFLERLKR